MLSHTNIEIKRNTDICDIKSKVPKSCKIIYSVHTVKHFHPEREQSKTKTILFKEFSRFAKENDVPYYPIDTPEDKEKFLKYKELSMLEKNVIFGGRHGHYVYVDMHQAIAMALNTFESRIARG